MTGPNSRGGFRLPDAARVRQALADVHERRARQRRAQMAALAAGAIALIFVVGIALTSTAAPKTRLIVGDAPTATSTTETSSSTLPASTTTPNCIALHVIGHYFLGPQGEKSSQPTPGAATVYQFDDGSRQLVPPAGFDPLQASSQTLFLFGFPQRPQDPEALARWEADFRNYKGAAPVAASRCPNISNFGPAGGPRP
jgi:hypothetical protein